MDLINAPILPTKNLYTLRFQTWSVLRCNVMQQARDGITNQIAGLQSTCNRFITQLWDSQVEKGIHPIYKCSDIAHQETCRFQTLNNFQEIFWTQTYSQVRKDRAFSECAGGHGQRLAIFREESLKPAVRCKCSRTHQRQRPPTQRKPTTGKNIISSEQNVWGCDHCC